MFTKAAKEDYKEISEILREAFDIEESTALKMLDMTMDDTYLIKDAGIICIASALDFKYGNRHGKYIYAVATKKDCQNKGYASKLIRALIEHFKGKYDVLLLKPANKGLYSFYKKNGFNDVIYADTVVYEEFSKSNISLYEGTFDDYINLRKLYTTFEWTEKVFKYNFDEYNYKVLYNDSTLLLYRIEDNICHIDEIYSNDIDNAVYCVYEITKANKIIVTTDGTEEFALSRFYKNKDEICFRLPME